MFLQIIVNGVIAGLLISLLALGFSLIYTTTRIFHVSYSVLFIFSSYMVFLFYHLHGINIYISCLISILLTALLSVLIDIVIYRPLINKKSSFNIIMISSIGFMIIAINLISLLFGNETKNINIEPSESLIFFDVRVTIVQLIQAIVSILCIFSFFLVGKFTRIGINARALRDDELLLLILGTHTLKIRSLYFFLSGIFAALGGILISYDVGIDPYMGMSMLINVFIALVIGGLGKFEASILGGLFVGLVQSITVYLLSSKWQDAATLLIFVIFLLIKPEGLLGNKIREF